MSVVEAADFMKALAWIGVSEEMWSGWPQSKRLQVFHELQQVAVAESKKH
jgi:hypothetical protein